MNRISKSLCSYDDSIIKSTLAGVKGPSLTFKTDQFEQIRQMNRKWDNRGSDIVYLFMLLFFEAQALRFPGHKISWVSE